MTSTYLSADVLTLAVITLTVPPMHTSVPWGMAGTLATLTQTSSEAGHVRRSLALLQAALQRQGAGQRVFTFLPHPAFLTVTPSTVTLAMS